MIEILSVDCKDRTGFHHYSVRILHEFGVSDGYLNPKKIQSLWKEASQHEVLFTDYTAGRIEPFLDVLMNPRSVWLEVFRLTDSRPIGVAYISHVVPGFDAKGHFTVWDRVAGGREPIFWEIMLWVFDRYGLRRISAETPPYQSGTIRFIRRLGFKEEGTKREAVIHKGRWMPLIEFGILREELEEAKNERLSNGERDKRDSDRDEERDGGSGETLPELDGTGGAVEDEPRGDDIYAGLRSGFDWFGEGGARLVERPR